jgi:hypothetical protein
MDDLTLLQTKFARLTIDYEHAVNITWIVSVSLRSPASAESIAAWKGALENEQQIAARRRELLTKLLAELGEPAMP